MTIVANADVNEHNAVRHMFENEEKWEGITSGVHDIRKITENTLSQK